ncbi:MAG: ABC transporter ATP-binding protein [bacterium]|jgi:iron complex transport system ATP-binding protein|nr:ABC transporter ATP-binding protein [Bacillota bacterium]HHW54726.1 ABC transporter ATP-binding protein [Bacillota bacterium]
MQKLLEVKNVSFTYDGKTDIFRDVSFSVNPGQIICILGPNGAGKTTLLNCIANLVPPTTGEILLEGKDMDRMAPQEVAKKIAFVPQFIVPSFAYEVLSYVVTGCAPRIGILAKPKEEHYEIARNSLAQMKISHLAEKYYTEISGGERQLVSIARALAQRPRVIIMDEPTAHLDYGNQIKVLEIIKGLAAQGYAAVITTHNPDQALMLGGYIGAISLDGQFSFGSSEEIINDAFLSSLYGIELHLRYIPDIGRKVCVAPLL